jgi:[acyl-carrier-protein] S-malonyltransferase
MGGSLYANHPSAKRLFDTASEVLGYDLADLCLHGPEDRLNATEFSQPALFTVGMAAATVLAELHPHRISAVTAAAGLSLGEYTAVCFAGGLSFSDGVRLVQRRGQAMQRAADAVESGMASVLGLELDKVSELCQQCRAGQVLQPANLLCPGNIVVSGHLSAIQRLIPAATEAGAMKVIPLTVAGAFHTSLMEPAVENLRAALDEMPITQTQIPVYSNVDAMPHQSADEIRVLLSRQVTEPVRWQDLIGNMVRDGVDGFEEVGTGRVLRGTLKRINRKLSCDGFGDDA